jgi:O-acetyl-ADP-ribose deacetylase (regulator of RNase III)
VAGGDARRDRPGGVAVITVRAGDLLHSDAQTLVCPSNTAGPMGAGLAQAFAQRYPGLERDHRAACEAGDIRPGRVWLWAGLFGQVICLPTKRHWRDPATLGDVDRALVDLARRVAEWQIASLAVPALGCGEGRLPWWRVAPLLGRRIGGLGIPVEVYPPAGAPAWQATAAFLADPGVLPIGRTVRCGLDGRVPRGAVYVGRAWPRRRLAGSPLANPYRLADPDDPPARRRVLEAYRDWLYEAAEHDEQVRAALEQVRGRDLACWCAPRPCHADVIAAWLLRHPAPHDPRGVAVADQLAAAAVVTSDTASRLAVVGSKRLTEPEAPRLARLIVLDELLRLRPKQLHSGGCVGVDRLAAATARHLGLDAPDQLVEHLPVPVRHPPVGMSPFARRGYQQRDEEIAGACSALLRLWSRSTHTWGSGWTAEATGRLGKPVGQVML